jgi:uncharacterized protein (TIGR00369 family)
MTHPAIAAMPFASLMQIDLTEAGPEGASARLAVRPELCTAGGILHGGAIMALADSLGAAAGFAALPDGASGTTTLESKTNFLGSAKVGTVVTARTTPVHRGRRTSVWQTRIEGEDGRAVALVIQTQMVLGV